MGKSFHPPPPPAPDHWSAMQGRERMERFADNWSAGTAEVEAFRPPPRQPMTRMETAMLAAMVVTSLTIAGLAGWFVWVLVEIATREWLGGGF